MDLTNIKTFLKVSELHSFSQAAAKLGYAQPTVSTQIAKLEQELGTLLFERMGHQISLTEKGRRFLPYAQQMLFLEEQIGQELNGESTAHGTLKIAMADSLCSGMFSKYLLEYKRRFPGISVVTQTGITEDLFAKLRNNETDMVYTLDNRISRSDFIVQQEQRENIHFCAAVDHPLAKKMKENTILTWEDIQQYPLYLTEAGVSYRYNLERLLGERGLELVPDIELSNVQTLLQITAQGEGISFLPEFILQPAVESGKIALLFAEGIQIQVWRQLIYRKGKYLTPAMQGMLDLLHGSSDGQLLR